MKAEKPSLWKRLRTPASLMLSLAVVALAFYGLHGALRHVNLRRIALRLVVGLCGGFGSFCHMGGIVWCL